MPETHRNSMRGEKTTLKPPGKPFFPKPLLLIDEHFPFTPCTHKEISLACTIKYPLWNHSITVCWSLEHPTGCWECCVIALLIWLRCWWLPWLLEHKNVSPCTSALDFASDDSLKSWWSERRDMRWLSGFGGMNGFSITWCFGNVSCNWNLIFQQVLSGCYLQTMWMLHFNKWHLN